MPIQMSSITPVTHTSIQHWWHAIVSDVLSLSHPFFSLTVEQKGQLEKESGSADSWGWTEWGKSEEMSLLSLPSSSLTNDDILLSQSATPYWMCFTRRICPLT